MRTRALSNQKSTWRSSFILIGLSFGIAALSQPSTVGAQQGGIENPISDRLLTMTTIHLKNGGSIVGMLEEITENKQRILKVTLENGDVTKLHRRQIRPSGIRRPPPAAAEYLQLRNKMADTVDAHWEMQQWCQQNRMPQQRELHLLRIVELDPDHSDARARLKHKDFGGVWINYDHFMQNNGYVKDARDVYQLPAAVKLSEAEDSGDDTVSGWTKKLNSWMKQVKRRNDQTAIHNIRNVTSPAAITGLRKLIVEEEDPAYLEMLVDVVGNIKSGGAQNLLVVIAMRTPSRDLQDQCVTLLKQDHYNADQIINTVMPFLFPKPTNPNRDVNNAAWFIGRISEGKDVSFAIRPLISALNTTHLERTGAGGGNMSVSQQDNGGGLSMGSKKQFYEQNYQNDSVLDTLRMLTNKAVDYRYDEQAWLAWYIREHSLQSNDLGRDR